MNAAVLNNTMVPYKYVIFSNRLDELNDPYELLYGVLNTNAFYIVNRCLLVPRDKCHPKGMQKFIVIKLHVGINLSGCFVLQLQEYFFSLTQLFIQDLE